ncbi:MAG: nucleotide-binding universal stress UspA family protein [Planctomycetota bacterium]|jgi:nucleotide-binding universal stress UspA family protein
MPAMHMDPSQAAKDAQNTLELLRDRFAGVEQVDMDAVVGSDIAATIVAQSNKHGADYICMATHGHAGIKRLLLGSVAEQVLRHSSVPVVIYPPRE